MSVSTSFLSHLYASETHAAILSLLTITHGSGVAYLVNDTQQVESNGTIFLPMPFDIILHHETPKGPGTVVLEIDNVESELGEKIKDMKGEGPMVRLDIVMSDTPDHFEYTLSNLHVSDAQVTARKISGQLSLHSLTDEKFPAIDFNSPGFPGLFK